MNKPLPSFETAGIGIDSEEYVARWETYDREIEVLKAAGAIHQDADGWWVDNATGTLIGEDPSMVRPLTNEDFARMVPFKDAHPDLYASIQRNKGGRPKSDSPKKTVTIRLDADLVARLKEGGAGWQTRVNDTLRKAVGL